MTYTKSRFGSLFKQFRLKSGFATLSEFADALAAEGMVYEESLFSHWQKGDRIPKDRELLLTILNIFIKKGGVLLVKEVNDFLGLANQHELSDEEISAIFPHKQNGPKKISPQKLLKFFQITAQSKILIRTGWKREKIKDTESVAEHSFQLSILAMVLADQFGLDTEKVIKMAIIHDLGELVTHDIVWTRGKIMDIQKRIIKEKAELDGIINVFKIIDKTDEFRKIFEEMIERRSPEAKIFWQLDKLEMAIQALTYEKKTGKNLGEFFLNSDLQIYSPVLRKIFSQVLHQRPK